MNRQQVAQGAVAAFAAAEALAWYLRRQEWARTLAAAQQTATSQGRALLVLDGGVGAFHGPSGVAPMDLSRLANLPDGSAVVCAAYTLEMTADPQHLWQEFLRIASVPTMIFTVSRQPWSATSAITPGTRWIVSRVGMNVPTFAPVGSLRVAAWAAGAATATVAAVLPGPAEDDDDAEDEEPEPAVLPVGYYVVPEDDPSEAADAPPVPEAPPAAPDAPPEPEPEPPPAGD